jgi:TldD protein
MLEEQIAKSVLDSAIDSGADFCDIFVEKKNLNTIQVLSSKVHSINSGIDFGVGIRLIFGTKVLYGYSNSIEKEEMLRITGILSSMDRKDPVTTVKAFDFLSFENIHPSLYGLDGNTDIQDKIDYLMLFDKTARAHHNKVSQVNAYVIQKMQEVEIFNTEGLYTTDTRHYTRVVGSVIAEDNGEQSNGYDGPGSLSGWEFSKTVEPKQFAEEVAKQAITKLYADSCPSGKMPVILDNGFGGVIFHEACGHLLETTSVAKKASAFYDKMDQAIASECVNAVDDGTLANKWGSENIDDEGMPTQKTQLIKDGKLVNFMVDKVGSMKTGYSKTGSGRRESYRFPPASRMRNTYIENGRSTLEDMITSIDSGVYCKKMGGGSVSPGTGEFNFNAQEIYFIKNGKIDKPLKSATLIGTGPEVLNQICMVGNNLELAAGMCGSISGQVPTTVGQPAIKLKEILVGGNK